MVEGVSVVAGLELTIVLVSVPLLELLLLLDGAVDFLPQAASKVATRRAVAAISLIFFIYLILLIFAMNGKASSLLIGHDGNIGYLDPSGLVGNVEDYISNILGLKRLNPLVKLSSSLFVSMDAN